MFGLSQEERSRLKKKDDRGGIILIYFHRKISPFLTAALYRTGVTPNQVTFLLFPAALAASVCFAVAEYAWLVAGGVLVQLMCVIDCSDGELARLRKMESQLGEWLDGILWNLGYALIFTGMAFGLYSKTHNITPWLLGFFAILSISMRNYIREKTLNVFKTTVASSELPAIKKISGLTRLKPQFINFTGDIRMSIITICAFFDRIDIALWILAVVGNIYWVIWFLLVVKKKRTG